MTALTVKMTKNVWNHIQLIAYFGILADQKKEKSEIKKHNQTPRLKRS